jgi:hypothetical protein
MNTKMQVYEIRESGNGFRVNHSSATAPTTSEFSMSQVLKSGTSMAISAHHSAYTMTSVHMYVFRLTLSPRP